MKAMIVGAGIGDLTAAIALRRAGVETTVFERAGELREVGAGLLLAVNAVRALDELGLSEKVRRLGTPASAARILSWREGIGRLVSARQHPRARDLRGGGLRDTHAAGDGALARRVKRATTWRMDLSQPVECHERFPVVGRRRRTALLSAFVAALLLPRGWSRNSMT